jgi:hypothetical protein
VKVFANLDERNTHSLFTAESQKYYHAERIGDYIYASSYYENKMQKINPRTGEIENIPLVLTDDDYEKIQDKPLFNPQFGIVSSPWKKFENPIITLPLFLNRLVGEVINENQISFETLNDYAGSLDGSCGVKVYENIKSEVL